MSTAFANEFIPYNVSQLSGIQLWLDAADSTSLTLSGSTVTAWRDKSGLSNDATINNSVTFNASDKSVRTDGTNGYFTSPLDTRKTTSTYYNVFLVYKWLSSSSNTNQSLWGNDVGGGWNRFQLLSFPSSTGIAYGLSRGATSPNTTNISALNTSNTLLYSANYAYNITNGSYAYVNGSQSINFTEVAASPETSTQLIFFGQLGSDQYFASIAFHEIIVARLEISNQTRQAIEGYLAWKWGLQNNLPSTHPYSLSPFYAFPPFPITNKVPKATNQSPFSANLYIGVAKSFDPTKITGCQLWFDAADSTTISTTGSNITQWRDKSTNAYSIAQATTSNQPFYVTNAQNKLPGVQLATSRWIFTESSNMPNFTTSSATSVFIAARNGTTGTGYNAINSVYLSGGSLLTTRYQLFFDRDSGSLLRGPNLYLSGSFRLQNTTNVVPASTAGVVGFVASSSSILLSVNGNTSTTTGAAPTSANDGTYFQFGDSRNNPSLSSDVRIYEMVGYSIALTITQRQEIEGYLAWKWGLQGSLPQTHPWKLFPPPPN